ncbi:alpha/beta hydrolase [Pseudomonas sp. MTM4]|uniref:alpha/beta hydrolase n=1 Tax=unclassified Pseudomonas TaxID=196821 RepID=UPI0018D27282|nr:MULTISPECIES: alpha/beta hydrolase [unclassified Pseudomonas]MBC8650333.1 alpha/beta hydrolase [Pseudomonas sp. MT4]QXY93633.1 alpha/beta hydrolase [Pseudomonas sp. MTM4]
MSQFPLFRTRTRMFASLVMAALLALLPVGCSMLEQKERELVFRIEPGTASWYRGLPDSVEELELTTPAFGDSQNIHAWWWPAEQVDAPAVLYLHGSRWNLTGHLFRLEQLRSLGFSILAIDYRGFGQSLGELPSEASVYQDARIAWDHLKTLQPDADKRLIYGHSLGGAVAVDLAAELGREAERRDEAPAARALIIESTFTNLADIATEVADTSWPIRWLLSQKFDSIDKIDQVGMPLLVVHGTADQYVPARFSKELYDAAQQPKRLLLIEGGTHNNSMRLGRQSYRRALDELLSGSGNKPGDTATRAPGAAG